METQDLEKLASAIAEQMGRKSSRDLFVETATSVKLIEQHLKSLNGQTERNRQAIDDLCTWRDRTDGGLRTARWLLGSGSVAGIILAVIALLR